MVNQQVSHERSGTCQSCCIQVVRFSHQALQSHPSHCGGPYVTAATSSLDPKPLSSCLQEQPKPCSAHHIQIDGALAPAHFSRSVTDHIAW